MNLKLFSFSALLMSKSQLLFSLEFLFSANFILFQQVSSLSFSHSVGFTLPVTLPLLPLAMGH